jgi:hypothetical protein
LSQLSAANAEWSSSSYIINRSDRGNVSLRQWLSGKIYLFMEGRVKQPSTQKLMSASPNKRVSNHELRHLYEEVLRLRELAAQSAKAARTNRPSSPAAISQKLRSRNLDAPVPRYSAP